MPLLIDENLSEALLGMLADVFPGSAHVRRELGAGASDEKVWAHAKAQGFVLVTRDQDFERMSVSRGAPPKVVWLRLGNAGNTAIADALRSREKAIAGFEADPTAAFLAVVG